MGLSQKEILVGTACQIAYEYPDWGQEHVSDMFDTFKHSGTKVSFDVDVLYEFTIKAARLKKEGKTYVQAEKALLQQL